MQCHPDDHVSFRVLLGRLSVFEKRVFSSLAHLLCVCAVMCGSWSLHGLCTQPARRSVHGISQARILGWPTMSFSRGYSPPRDRNCASWFSACLFGYFSFGFLNMRNIYLILKWKRYVQSSLTFILPTPERQPCAVIPFITPLTLLRSHLRVWRPRS